MDGIGLPLPWGIVPMERVWVEVDVPNPAAGADWSARVPQGVLWVVRMFEAVLTTAAGGAGRVPSLSITDGENELARLRAVSNGIGAAQSNRVSGLLLAVPGPLGPGTRRTCGLPYVVLQPGWTFGVVTSGLMAGDQWSAIGLEVEEYELRGLESAWEAWVHAYALATTPGLHSLEWVRRIMRDGDREAV